MLFFLALSCVKYGPVQAQHKHLISSLETASADEWTIKCAPKEMALAASHKQFAELEFQQGGQLRAEEHLLFALSNVEEALKKNISSLACVV